MSYKVLITCPPMLKQIEVFEDKFKKLDIEITTPKVIQTLSEEKLIEILPTHDGWIIGDDPATSKVFEAGKSGSLKAAVKWGVGVDNVDFEACKRLSIPICNTPKMFGAEVADLAMCYILGLARNAFYIDRKVREGNWPKISGISLSNKIVGIVGLGDIGLNIAKRANAHDLKILGWDPLNNPSVEYIQYSNKWPEGIESCDFIVFACALNSDNYHLFNKELLVKLKPGVRIINVSRGGLIDENALIEGLSTGLIESVALDVFEEEPPKIDNPIVNHPNCILGSHNGSNTVDAVIRASDYAIDLLSNMLSGE